MTMYPLPNKKRARVSVGLFLFVMLLLARDTLYTTALMGFYKAQFLMVGLMCLGGAAFLWYNRRRWKQIFTDRRLLVFALFALAVLGPMALKRDWQMMYLSILICIAFGVFLSYFLTCAQAAKYYVAMMSALGLYSIVALWVLRPLLVDTGLWQPPVVFNSLEIMFYNFGLAFVSDWYAATRNFGIFREPGVYQYFLILALVLNNYHVCWRRGWALWSANLILAAAMLTTLSTAGVAVLGLLAVVVFFDKKLYRSWKAWAVVGVLVLALTALVLYIIRQAGVLYWELYGMVLSKFQPGEDSAVERVEAVAADLLIFLRHPLLGGKLSDVLYAAVNNTASTLILFAGLGIAAGGLHVASWVALVWSRERKLWANLGLLVVLFLSFNTQNLTADVFFWLFPVLALTHRVLPLLSRRERKGAARMDRQTLLRVQKLQLEMAKQVKRMCQENDIRYYLYRGTLLGAVRHQGFIPWDDDMDIAMPRADYEKFRRLAPEKLGEDLYFQDWHTDPGYALPFGKVRKRGTVYVESKCPRFPENGVYIDIYPLDFAPETERDREVLRKKLLHLFRVKLMKSGYTPWMEEDKVVWKKRLGYLYYQFLALFTTQQELIEEYEALVAAVPPGDTLYEQSALPIAYYYRREWYAQTAEYLFVDETFAGPRDYDAFLTALYGQYMRLPPEDRRENRHQIKELNLGE